MLSPIASAGSLDGLLGFLVSASLPGWSCDAFGALALVAGWRLWSQVALAGSLWGVAVSVDALAVALAAVSSVDVSALFTGSLACSCTRWSSSLSSLPATTWPIPCDSFVCGWVCFGGVVDSTDNGGGGGLTRSSTTCWSSHGLLAGVVRLTLSVRGYSVVFVPDPVAAAASLSLPCGIAPFSPTRPSIATCSSPLVVHSRVRQFP